MAYLRATERQDLPDINNLGRPASHFLIVGQMGLDPRWTKSG
jgi:hypothetical protein